MKTDLTPRPPSRNGKGEEDNSPSPLRGGVGEGSSRVSTAFQTLIIAVSAVIFAGCGRGNDGWSDKPGPKVLAFFPPIYSWAATIAGDDAQVQSLLKSKGPHEYEPQPADARRLAGADLFLAIGLGLDDAVVKKLADTCGNSKLRLVELGEKIPKDQLLEGYCTHEDHRHDGDHDHGTDPHVWLGIPQAVEMIAVIRDQLSEVDPAHSAGYHERAKALADRLQAMQTQFQAELAAKKEKARLITQHDSLQYFARSFGIEIAEVIDLPGREPSSKRLNEIVDKCNKQKVRLIGVEPQYSSNTGAQAVLHELRTHNVPDAVFVELDPMETADVQDLTPDFYERHMRANLENLLRALK